MFRAAKLVFNDWQYKVKVTGSYSDMKILQIGQLRFLDLCLMAGAGCKLK